MPCYHPRKAWQRAEGAPISFTNKRGKPLQIPCNNCIGCRVDRTRNWAIRCLHESQLHADNCFLTLTERPPTDSTGSKVAQDARYSRANTAQKSPVDSVDGAITLSVKTHQRFMKNFRQVTGQKIRFYMCGEYGAQLARPHYHYLIFGYNFADRRPWCKNAQGETLYRSELLDSIWKKGHAWIGEVSYQSCAYVAAYVMKKITGDMADDHYRRTDEAGNDYWLTPEFNLMSRNPGIAKAWFEKFHTDVFPHDRVMTYETRLKPPRYYDKLLEVFDAKTFKEIKQRREQLGRKLAPDNTPARLAAKETVARARLATKQRQLENS